jgi:hypothetical protein
MSNVVKFSINGDTNAEQVAGRAKAAVNGLDKQFEGIGKKFSSSFKDIFLSFLGPMALLGTAIAFIGKIISDNQKKQEEANQAAIDGTNKLMSTEDRYWANRRNNEKKGKEEKEQATLTREEITKDFLENDPRGKKIINESDIYRKGSGESASIRYLSRNKAAQDMVQAIIAEEIKNSTEGSQALKDSTFRGPEGFSNVIGVGANPVLENLTRQTDIQQQILDHIRSPKSQSGITDVDFTKNPIDIRNVS